MNMTDKFLTEHTTPERRDMLMKTYDLLVTLGHVDHELNIDNLVALYGSVETVAIVMLIEEELMNACHMLLLSYFIVCRKETSLPPYLQLLDFLNYIENTIESETIIHFYNEELTALDQFMSWVEVFRNDLLTEIGSLILDITPSLIENIIQTHELKVDVEVVEFDQTFHDKIKYLKSLKEISPYELLPIKLIKSQTIKSLMNLDDISAQYNKLVYSEDAHNSEATPFNIVGLAMLSFNDINSLKADIIVLINALYDDLKKTTLIMREIDKILDPSGELCKIMNTI